MAKKYEKEFKLMIVNLINSGQKVSEVAQEYELNEGMLRRWRREFLSSKEEFTGRGNISLTPEEKEIRRLKKELKEAQLERDILKKAICIFSKSDKKNTSL